MKRAEASKNVETSRKDVATITHARTKSAPKKIQEPAMNPRRTIDSVPSTYLVASVPTHLKAQTQFVLKTIHDSSTLL